MAVRVELLLLDRRARRYSITHIPLSLTFCACPLRRQRRSYLAHQKHLFTISKYDERLARSSALLLS